jgi:hypothetical protein
LANTGLRGSPSKIIEISRNVMKLRIRFVFKVGHKEVQSVPKSLDIIAKECVSAHLEITQSQSKVLHKGFCEFSTKGSCEM